MYEIEKDIPVPLLAWCDKYPFADMEINDSFFASLPEGIDKKSFGNNIRSAGRPSRWNMKFTVRWIKAENGFRVWRIE